MFEIGAAGAVVVALSAGFPQAEGESSAHPQTFPPTTFSLNCYSTAKHTKPMNKIKHKQKNNIILYRRRMGFTQRRAAQILGLGEASVSRIERGKAIPSLETALGLEILLRVPVAFLFPQTYDSLRNQIRAIEDQVQPVRQGRLF